MFTLQRKMWPNSMAFALHRGDSASAKGKGVTEGPPPSLVSLSKTTVSVGLDDAGNAEDSKWILELGLLDEAVMQRKDHKALMDKVTKLEKEQISPEVAVKAAEIQGGVVKFFHMERRVGDPSAVAGVASILASLSSLKHLTRWKSPSQTARHYTCCSEQHI